MLFHYQSLVQRSVHIIGRIWIFDSGKLSYTVGYKGNRTLPQEIMMQTVKNNMLIIALVLVFGYLYTFSRNLNNIFKNSRIYAGFQKNCAKNHLFSLQKGKILFLKWMNQIFSNLCRNIHTSRQLFWKKKLRGCVTLYGFSQQYLFKK